MVRSRNPSPSPRNVPQLQSRSSSITPSSPMSSSPMLIDLIERHKFQEAVARIREMPSEATMTITGASGAHNSIMGQGNLALHEACKNQPPIELIDALLEANESAVQTKGQWGYLPLHFACCSRASPEVVARLIVTYPSATRTKDDHEGFLPLHLASKWGADDEVIMALLTVHPKASTVRDLSGKTPIDHAATLSSPHVREAVVKALRRAPILCTVSKAAMNKLAYESDAKLREVVEVYQERMTEVKEKYDQDKTNAVALEVQLRKELWDEKERSARLSEKVVVLERQLKEKEREMQERLIVLDEIQELISGKRKPRIQIEAMQRQEDMERRETETLARKKDEQQIARNAVREWVSAGNHQIEQSRDDEIDERREAPPSPGSSTSAAASPRSAAVATVKEWFASDTKELLQPEDHNVSAGNTRYLSQRDKIEQYRSPTQVLQHRPEPIQTSSVIPSSVLRNPKHSNEQPSTKTSLLNRSMSAPRSSAVLARREHRKLSGGGQDYNPRGSSNNTRQHSLSPSPVHHHQQQQQPLGSSPTNPYELTHDRNKSGSYSGSSRYTPPQGNGSMYRSQTQSHSSSTRRPRESYSTAKAPTSAYSHRIMDDANESLTMDSNIDWE